MRDGRGGFAATDCKIGTDGCGFLSEIKLWKRSIRFCLRLCQSGIFACCGISFAPLRGLAEPKLPTHGSRRGLHSAAATRLLSAAFVDCRSVVFPLWQTWC